MTTVDGVSVPGPVAVSVSVVFCLNAAGTPEAVSVTVRLNGWLAATMTAGTAHAGGPHGAATSDVTAEAMAVGVGVAADAAGSPTMTATSVRPLRTASRRRARETAGR